MVLSKMDPANGDISFWMNPPRVDVGTKAELHALIGDRAAQGAAFCDSSELPDS